jgi:hypothetical protein
METSKEERAPSRITVDVYARRERSDRNQISAR